MIVVAIAFMMVAGLTIAAVLKLEAENRSEQFARLKGHRKGRFTN